MPRVAIAHDYLTQRGGAERLLLEISATFPDAPIYTTLFDPEGTFGRFSGMTVNTSYLDRLRVFQRSHRLAFPLLAHAAGRMHIDTDVLICSSAGWSHGFQTTGKKLVYCNTPAKWIYDLERYAGGRSTSTYLVGRALRPALARWDRHAAATADRYIASSTEVRNRIRTAYGIEASVLHPPVLIETEGPAHPIPGVEPGFYLVASRLLPYKNVSAVVEAFRGLSDRLVVVGAGPMLSELRTIAPPNVSIAGEVSDETLRWAFKASVGVVTASWEDFGLVPIEAAAHGKPTAALRWGGHLDTIIEDETGIFFESPEPALIAQAVERLATSAWNPARLRAQAGRFSPGEFREELRRHVAEIGEQ